MNDVEGEASAGAHFAQSHILSGSAGSVDISKDALTDLSSIAAGDSRGNVMDELASRLESAPTGLDTAPANTDGTALGTKRKNLLDIIKENPIPSSIMGATS